MDTQPCAANEQGAPLDLQAQIAAEFCNRPAPIKATTYLRKWNTNSQPVALLCDGGDTYVVKALQAGRTDMGRVLVNEQVVARIGKLMHAAVPHVALIDVPAELITSQPEMSHITPGVAHGSQFVENVTERMQYENAAIAENRPRFALLAVLFGWTGAQDHQFVYEKTSPHLVYSVDHGFFFPGGSAWTEASLGVAPPAQPDIAVINACGTTEPELHQALHALSAIVGEALISVVSLPPDEWGLTMGDRIALFNFLTRRRAELLALLPPGN
jgi:hypothetical protein